MPMLKRGQVTEKTNMTEILERPTVIDGSTPGKHTEAIAQPPFSPGHQAAFNTLRERAEFYATRDNRANESISNLEVLWELIDAGDEAEAETYAELMLRHFPVLPADEKGAYVNFLNRREIAAENEKSERLALGAAAKKAFDDYELNLINANRVNPRTTYPEGAEVAEPDKRVLEVRNETEASPPPDSGNVIEVNFRNHRAA